MADIDAILTQADDGLWDMAIGDDGDIDTAASFDAAILVSLFTDRRADASEIVLPERRRGWVGNEATPGFQIGSRLWLLDQARATKATALAAGDYAREALQWLVDDGYAVSVNATASFTSSTLVLNVDIVRPNGDVEHRLFELWDNTGTE